MLNIFFHSFLGVQDLVYTRVFAMIVVKDNFNIKDPNPFEVHAFVCDSR